MNFEDRISNTLKSAPPGRSVRRRRWLEVLLTLGFLFCLLVGLGALAVLWQLYPGNHRARELDDPLSSLQAGQILPELALMELAGEPGEALAYQALHAGYLETSRAILMFDATRSGPAHDGILLQLARRYREQEKNTFAQLLYRQVRDAAVLAPTVSALERSHLLIQCVEGLLAIGDRTAALDSAIQVKQIGQYAADLLPAQRAQLFTQVRPLAEQLGDENFRQQVAELARNPYVTVQGATLPSQLWRLVQPVAFDAPVATAIATRQQRARELVDRIMFTRGVDIDPERQALAQALLAEDLARSEFLRQQQAGHLPLAQQAGLWLDHRAWVLWKVRIAAQGYGLALLPEWEANQEGLLRELGVATSNLDNLLMSLASAQSDSLLQAQLQVEARSWLALQNQLGLYPHVLAADLGQRLSQAQAELAQRDRPLALPVAYNPLASGSPFRIQPVP
jgi:hypothetical protein